MIGIFLDTETNGLNFQKHRVLEMAYCLVDLYNGKKLEEFCTIVTQPLSIWEKSDPISLSVNGFKYDMLKNGITEEQLRQKIKKTFKERKIVRNQAVYICQNPSFDRTFFSQIVSPEEQEALQWPYHWLDFASMFWSLAIDRHRFSQGPLPWEVGYSKDKIAHHYGLPPEVKPHRAINGVNHLIDCYTATVGFLSPSDNS